VRDLCSALESAGPRVRSAAMPWLEMWLPPAAGEGATAAGLFLDAAAHSALLAAMPGCSVSFSARRRRQDPPGFLSLSMSVKESRGFVPASVGLLPGAEEKGGAGAEEAEALMGATGSMTVADVVTDGKVIVVQKAEAQAGAGAMNLTKHLWAGAVAAMVSRYSRSFCAWWCS
jgi:hypothetical protein